ncbi:MAG: Cof-type HAD-IIB family hydrolase [Pseudobutyrivibrio sp.]|nr:Cof-type HAD-IIB family hydrolase [Pseudobutyrivibrio sp.]
MKAVFFDIDGTLWDSDNVIPESTVEAIRQLRANGHKAFICSGRAKGYICNPKLLEIGWDGIVAACGCHVEIGDELVYSRLITREEGLRDIKLVQQYGFKPVLEGPRYLYLDESDFTLQDFYGNKLRREMGENLLPLTENTGNWEFNKFACATEVPSDVRLECFEKLKADYLLLPHNEAVCEMVPAGHSKATGMKLVCKTLGIDMKDTYAFGDSVNDLEMLSAAGVGIAMGNGTIAAKEAAEYVTTDLHNDGIMNGLRHFGLIS